MSFVLAKSLKPPAIASACTADTWPLIGECSRRVHLAHDVEHRRNGLDDDDGDDRVGVVFLERGHERIAQFGGGPALRRHVADERKRDLSIRPDLERLRQLRITVDLDPKLVAGDEAVVG